MNPLRKAPLVRRSELRARSRPKAWRRPESDRVTEELANYIYVRDRMACRAPYLAGIHGEDIDACSGRLTIEHVHSQPTMGKRAMSDRHHTLLLCMHHNVDGWASMHKAWERAYLEQVEGKDAA